MAEDRAGERAGEFDYYVLALSWNASWCETEGDRRDAAQCDPSEDHGWLLHGLWPQYDRGGWPDYCRTEARDPPRRMTAAMSDVMGSGGLAWYQWKKHGRCSGLTAEEYFRRARDAFLRVAKPGLSPRLDDAVRIRPDVVEALFRDLNPEFSDDAVTVTCRDGRIAEIRACLTRGLEPRPCGDDVLARACSQTARLPAIR